MKDTNNKECPHNAIESNMCEPYCRDCGKKLTPPTTDFRYEPSKEFYQFCEDLKIADAVINRDGIIEQWWLSKFTDLARTIRDDLMEKRTHSWSNAAFVVEVKVIRKYFEEKWGIEYIPEGIENFNKAEKDCEDEVEDKEKTI